MSVIDITEITIKAIGGVALFIYGMTLLGKGLEKLSGGHIEKIFRSLTDNIFKSVLLGAVVTAAIQSSGATTVVVVGLVNAGILPLSSAVGVIMGANIGTTITGQILRLAELNGTDSALKLLTPEVLSPVFVALGLLIYMLSKKDGHKTAGEILIGLGVLFMGMNTMTESVSPLSELEGFRRIFTVLSNPVLGILAGFAVTFILQSSSASVGILQAISKSGILPFSTAFPIIMGQNIGTCMTPLISSIGAGKNAKRAAFVHIYFNVIGTVLFLAVIYILKYTVGLPFWNDQMTMSSIATFHTFFNIIVTIVFIPFHKLLEKLATMTIREQDLPEEEAEPVATVLDNRFLKSPSLAIQQAMNTVVVMGKTALHNYTGMRKLFSEFDEKTDANLRACEKSIDRMEDKLSEYLIKLSDCELTNYENRRVTLLLHLTSEFERIGDYTMNLIESAEQLDILRREGDPEFSDSAKRELGIFMDAVEEIIRMAVECTEKADTDEAFKIEPLEEVIDYLNEAMKARHIERLKKGTCIAESGINFLDLLINLERISDHCSNIGVYIISSKEKKEIINRHEYIANIHHAKDQAYSELFSGYLVKYSI